MKTIQVLWLIIGSIALAGFLYLTSVQLDTAKEQVELTRENNTYHRMTSCILSKTIETRTPEYISECYNKAEEATGIKVDRYGSK